MRYTERSGGGSRLGSSTKCYETFKELDPSVIGAGRGGKMGGENKKKRKEAVCNLLVTVTLVVAVLVAVFVSVLVVAVAAVLVLGAAHAERLLDGHLLPA